MYFLDVYKDGENVASLESKDSLVLMDLSPDGSKVLYLADNEGEVSTLMVYFVGEGRSQVIREGVILGYGWFLPAEDE